MDRQLDEMGFGLQNPMKLRQWIAFRNGTSLFRSAVDNGGECCGGMTLGKMVSMLAWSVFKCVCDRISLMKP